MGKYKNTSLGTCQICNSDCLTCSTGSTCEYCKNGHSTVLNGQCNCLSNP